MWLFDIFIEPLKMVFEMIFSLFYKIIPNPAVDIVFLSLAVNFLALPLYLRADKIQKETRDREDKLRPMTDHIKKSFKGDEKVMMLQTYYDQQHYHPLSSLKSIISLLLQIPFFIAAYQFLSHLAVLDGNSLGPIKNLIEPDGLITIGGIAINVLPILMTVINIISSEIYTRGQPFKSKIVLYVTALIFLVLLYDSPSGLVFYWTLNNLFSLVKNLVPHRANENKEKEDVKPAKQYTFFFAAGYITLFLGVLIPSQVINASPTEFINRMSFDNPSGYVFSAALISIGLYFFWPSVYYLLMNGKWRKIFGIAASVMAFVVTVNYLFFGPVGRRLTTNISIDGTYSVSVLEMVINIVVIAAVAAAVIFLSIKTKNITKMIFLSGMIAVLAMGIINVVKINNSVNEYIATGISELKTNDVEDREKVISLSSTEKNVVIIMMDRAIGGMVPYIFNELPSLKEQFDGFTYYANTISYADHTTMGAPPLYGGYEYTPDELKIYKGDERFNKHNESLLVLPVLFSNNGYHSTIIDPPDISHNPIPDMTVYDKYEGVDGYLVAGTLDSNYGASYEALKNVRGRNIVRYSLLRAAPPMLHGFLYDNGNYNYLEEKSSDDGASSISTYQLPYSMSRTTGLNMEFMTAYSALTALPGLTDNGADKGNLIVISNNTAHEPAVLQEPLYVPSEDINNESYDSANSGRFTVDGRTMRVDDYDTMSHYHVNAATYITLGQWFDQLRKLGVWDNTKIIIVSDHGRALKQFTELDNEALGMDIEAYNPVLLVKDFGSTGFNISNDLMTNADVPSIACKDVIDDPVNPFTGNKIDTALKDNFPVKIVNYNEQRETSEGNVFIAKWYQVHDNIWDKNCWEYVGEQ